MHISNDFSSFVSLGQPDRTLGRTTNRERYAFTIMELKLEKNSLKSMISIFSP
jgi:hypothetical protein